MSMPGPTELIIILAIVLVIFGAGRLTGIGKSMGTAIREFKDSLKGKDKASDEEKKSTDQ